jgi:hypothetical protein
MNTLLRMVCPLALLTGFTAASAQQIAPPGAPVPDTHAATAGGRADEAMTVNALAGFVNAEPIFVEDVLRPIDEQLQQIAARSRNLSEFRSAARPAIHTQLQNSLFNIMVGSKAKAALSEQEKMQIEIILRMQLHDLLASHGGSRALADQELRARGSSVDKDLDYARRDLIQKLYFHKEFAPRIVITRQMVLDAYQRDPKQWQQEAELELFNISIPVARWLREPTTDGTRGAYIKNPTPAQVAEAEKQAMATARQLIDRLKKGEDFAILAEDNSADERKNFGGRYPHVKRGSMPNQALENYIFSLPANTVGEPQLVRDPDPLQEIAMVVKVGDKQEAHQVTFAEAQKDIVAKLQQQQSDELKKQFLLKLQESTPVENLATMEDTVVDAAVTRYVVNR